MTVFVEVSFEAVGDTVRGRVGGPVGVFATGERQQTETGEVETPVRQVLQAVAVGEFRGEPCEVEVDVGSCGVERGFLSPFGEVASELV